MRHCWLIRMPNCPLRSLPNALGVAKTVIAAEEK